MVKKLFTVLISILLIFMQVATVFAEDGTSNKDTADQAITQVEKSAQISNDTKVDNSKNEESPPVVSEESSKKEETVKEEPKEETKSEEVKEETKSDTKEEKKDEEEIKFTDQVIFVNLYEDKNLENKLDTSTKISIKGNFPEDLEINAYIVDKDNEDKYLDYKFIFDTSIKNYKIDKDILIKFENLNNFNIDYELYKIYDSDITKLEYKTINESKFEVEVSKFDELYVLIPEQEEPDTNKDKTQEDIDTDNEEKTNIEENTDNENIEEKVEEIELAEKPTLNNPTLDIISNLANLKSNPADTYNIIVNFVFSDNSIALDPIVITVNAGDMCSQVIHVESIVGYEPYYNDEVVNHLDIDITEVNSNINYFITYRPIKVEYTVEHYLQNADDDNYTLADVDTGYEYTGVELDNLERIYEGFISLAYEKPVVAADGSTVVEIYYDREYSLITFNLQGGYGVDPIYQKWGSTITVGTPQKNGYTFRNWNKTIPATMPLGGDNFIANWSSAGSPYTIIYWKENADNDDYSFWGSEQKNAPTGSIISGSDTITTDIGGSEVVHFNFNSELSDKNIEVKGDGTSIINVYYDRKIYTITLKTSGNDYICGFENHTHSYDHIALIYYGGCYPEEGVSIDDLDEEHTICGQEEHIHTYDRRAYMYFGGCYGDGSETPTCGQEEHTHTYSCYTGTTSTVATGNARTTLNNTYPNAVNGQVGRYRRGNGGSYTYYIYINGSWYQYNGSTTYGNIAQPNCGLEQHMHSYDSKTYYYFGGCYPETGGTETICGHEYHEHQPEGNKYRYYGNCYPEEGADEGQYICGLEEHTHNSACRGTLIHRISAKYGSNILDEWTFTGEDGVDYPTTSPVSTWKPVQSDIYSERLANIQIMPGENSIFELYTSNNSMKTYEYYVEALPGQTADRVYNGTNYVLHYSMVHDFNYYTQAEDFLEFDGFTKQYARTSNGTDMGTRYSLSANQTYYMYYTRNKYKIEYQSRGEILTQDANENSLTNNTYTQIPYQLSLENYNIEPPYPSNEPAGAYTFGGWYDNSDFAGSPFNFSSKTMPSSDVVLFAKWIPDEYTVKVFLDLTQAEADTNPLYTLVESYGDVVDPIDTPTPVSDEYIFMGWFYNDNGTEKPFVFGNTLITQDISVYAKWTSNIIRPYNIYFTDTEGNELAEPIHGSGYAGTTKTFVAKEDVPDGYFPMIKSHSIIINIDGTDENGINDFTFIYDNAAPVPYTVHYINRDTGEIIAPDKYLPNNRAVKVTEKFKYIEGYVPDAYQKTLIVSINGNNEITFYYTQDVEHAFYITNHYYQNGDSWTLYNSMETFGNIGDQVNAVPMNIPGYELDLTIPGTIDNGTVIPQGLEMDLYYIGRLYPYEIRYVDRNTGIAIHEPTGGEARYMTTLTAEALEISGYDVIEAEKSIVIQQENSSTVRHNIITFYYQREQARFDYIPSTGGRVSNNYEVVAAVAGIAMGSNAIPSEGYEFDGWYLDENYTQPVTAIYATVNDTNIVPEKQNGRYLSRTFYAKFKPTTLTMDVEKVDFNMNLISLVARYKIYKIDSTGSIVKSYKGTNINCSLVDTITTSDNLSITLQRGESYLLEEVEAPEGYSTWNGLAKLSISTDGFVLIDSELREGMITYDNLLHKLTLKDDPIPIIPSGFNDSMKPYLFVLFGILLLLGVISVSYRLSNNKVVKKKN